MSWSIYDNDRFPEDERNCSECTHRVNGKCELWECSFEEKEEMTLTKALKIADCFEIDYSGMSERDVEELDEAIDKIFTYARKWIDERTGERQPREKNEFGVVTKWQCKWCCCEVGKWQSYCGNCGRRLTYKGEEV